MDFTARETISLLDRSSSSLKVLCEVALRGSERRTGSAQLAPTRITTTCSTILSFHPLPLMPSVGFSSFLFRSVFLFLFPCLSYLLPLRQRRLDWAALTPWPHTLLYLYIPVIILDSRPLFPVNSPCMNVPDHFLVLLITQRPQQDACRYCTSIYIGSTPGSWDENQSIFPFTCIPVVPLVCHCVHLH